MIISDEGEFIIATPTKCGTTTMEAIGKREVNVGKLALVASDRERAEIELMNREEGFKIHEADVLDGLDTRRRQHRMSMPYGTKGYRAYLLARNPASRWVSVYEYLRSPRNYSQWGAAQVQGVQWGAPNRAPKYDWEPLTFIQFLNFVTAMREEHPRLSKKRGKMRTSQAYRSPWVWLDGLDFSLFQLEHNAHSRVRLLHLESLGQDLENLVKKRGVEADITMTVRNKTAHKPWQEYWTPKAIKIAEKKVGVPRECEAVDYEWKDWM